LTAWSNGAARLGFIEETRDRIHRSRYNRGVFVFSDLIRCGFALMIRLFYAGGDFVRGPSSIAEDFWLPRVQVSLLRHFLDCLLFSRCRQ
jgi:hypothetical protein